MMEHIAQSSPALIPVLYLMASILIPIAGYFRVYWAYIIALLFSLAAFTLSAIGLIEVLNSGTISYHLGGWMPPLGIELVLDPLSAFLMTVISGSTLMVMFYAEENIYQELPYNAMPFYSLSMLLMGGLAGMTLTGDLFNLYVFLEIVALAAYALLAIGDKRAPFSAFRYLTLGTAGAAFYLLGVSFIFISTGTLNMADIAAVLPYVENQTPVIMGLIFIIVGVGIKMGLLPLHHWLPDAYTYASSTATALIAPIGTKVAAYVLIRALTMFEFPPIIDIVTWVAAASIIGGSILAISQSNIKRMLAYSSVANIGYIVMGITLANPLAFIGALLHVMNHAMMKIVLFLAAGGIFNNMGTLNINKLRGFPVVMPLTALAFFIAVLSMVGIPPTGGFFSKLYLLLGAIDEQAWFFVFAIILSTLLALVYLFKIINIVFFRPYHPSDDSKMKQSAMPEFGYKSDNDDQTNKEFESLSRNEMKAGMVLPLLIVAAGIILVGIFNGPIVEKVLSLSIPELPQFLR